jgi:23S rRNA (pseudouridine1915-N3)-methyltransferase
MSPVLTKAKGPLQIMHGDAARATADLVIGFGAMTWPHLLVRAMLAEQLFRATSILAGHPYHRSG